MKSTLTILLFCILTLTSVQAQESTLDRQAIIKYRRLFMEIKGKHNQAIKLLVMQEIPFHSHIVTHAEALSNMAEDMLRLFPKGSQGPQSRALPSIWDKDGNLSSAFIAQVDVMKKEAKKMAEVAKAGDNEAIRQQLRQLASNGCRGCHTLFRGE